MAIEIIVPRLGWSSEDGLFAGWLKQPGERVSIGEPLFALESDKVTMEVESLDNGILRLLPGCPEPGSIVLVGQLLGHLLAEGEPPPSESRAAPAPTSIESAPAVVTAEREVSRSESRRAVSPRARAAAKRLGIAIDTVPLTPGAQRVVEADVLRRSQSGFTSRSRKIIAARLEESFRTPHFYVHAEIDGTPLAKLRDELLPALEARHGIHLTYNDLFVKAVALVLGAQRHVNCCWSNGEIVQLDSVHVGLAVQTDDNLFVPVIRDAGRLTLAEIAAERQRLVDKCRRSDLKPSDLEGGSITISNLGPYGVDRFQAVLNPPQSAILAVGRAAKRPFVDGDAIVARLTIPLSLSVDHRVIDGVAAAKFLQGIANLLHSPSGLN